MDLSVTRVTGARALAEVEEVSLDEILSALRMTVISRRNENAPKSYHPRTTGISGLDNLATKNFEKTQTAQLSVSGRSMPFIYALLDHLVSPPHRKTVTVIDLESRFDPTRLLSKPTDIAHIHIFRIPPPPRQPQSLTTQSDPLATTNALIRDIVSNTQDWMLYGDHRSIGREWWGTIVLGAPGGQVWTGWRGWLRVDAEEIPGFSPGIGIREARVEKARRQMAVDGRKWVVSCPWGRFAFRGRMVEEEAQKENERVGGTDGANADIAEAAKFSIGEGLRERDSHIGKF